jgi:hypothetical protein
VPSCKGAGQPIVYIYLQIGISEATYSVWKKRYTNMGLLELRELRQLRDENARPKRLVAEIWVGSWLSLQFAVTADAIEPILAFTFAKREPLSALSTSMGT